MRGDQVRPLHRELGDDVIIFGVTASDVVGGKKQIAGGVRLEHLDDDLRLVVRPA